jgi:hypothetical protein
MMGEIGRWRLLLPILGKASGGLVLAAGVALGLLVVGGLGWSAVGLAGLGGGLALTQTLSADRAFLRALFVAAYTSRLVVATLIYYLASALAVPSLLFPDAGRYDEVAWELARQWRGATTGVEIWWPGLYESMVGAIYLAVGHVPLAAIFLNAALAAMTAVLVAGTAQRLFDVRTARLAAVATAFFPSVFFWSVLLLRDALYLFLVAVCLWAVVECLSARRAWYLLPAVIAWLALKDVRQDAFILLGLLASIGLVLGWRLSRLQQVIVAGLLVAALVGAFSVTRLSGLAQRNLNPMLLLIALEDRRVFGAVSADSAYVSPQPPPASNGGDDPLAVFFPPLRASRSLACQDVRLTANPPDPRPAGATITFSARATLCGGPPEYKWWVLAPGSTWTQVRDWGDAEYVWDTTDLDPGDYKLAAWARVAGSETERDTYANIPFSLLDAGASVAPPSDVDLAPDRAASSPDSAGTLGREAIVGNVYLRTLYHLPRGLVYMQAAPFPWDTPKLAQKLTIPDLLLWYACVPLAAVGVVLGRRRWRLMLVPLGYVLATAAALTLGEGNTGTLFRHRAMLIPWTVMHSAAGALWLWDRWQASRRAERGEAT